MKNVIGEHARETSILEFYVLTYKREGNGDENQVR
jgi:hypothetical protein